MDFYSSLLVTLGKELVAAWRHGGKRTRAALSVSAGLIVVGFLAVFLGRTVLFGTYYGRLWEQVGTVIGGIGGLVAFAVYVIQRSQEAVRQEQKIEAVERRVQENPHETQAAWELARVKLESYLKRNLSQVKSIFWTLLVMFAGFTLIGVGVYEAFRDPASFQASILTTSSGVLVSFIGGTFLILYKATMAQARDYVTILERINAVGMSVQILETLNAGSGTLKDETTADIAKQLLRMYSVDPSRSGPSKARRSDSAVP